jgi:L-threonylcarbamoyladenylate synthase
MEDKINKAREVVLNGGVILYPTDTIWGIGCSAIIESGIKKIFRIKRRDNNKLLISLVSSIEMLERYVKNVPEYVLKYLYDESPTTIIYPKVTGLNQILYGKNESIAIRLVKDNFCRALIEEINTPLISTSANISGNPFPKKFKEIDKKIVSGVDYVVNFDDSNLENSKPSRIIKVLLNGQIEIIRE